MHRGGTKSLFPTGKGLQELAHTAVMMLREDSSEYLSFHMFFSHAHFAGDASAYCRILAVVTLQS